MQMNKLTIITAEETYKSSGPMDRNTAPERAVIHYWPGYAKAGLPTSTRLDHPGVDVMVNHGRWVVLCMDCLAAQVASPLDKRFFCCECGNENHGGQWLHVNWPEDQLLIESILERRPARENQNWTVALTAEKLEAINRENGF